MGDTLKELEAELVQVNAAIKDIEAGGQKLVVGDREYTAADLGDLLKHREALWGAIAGLRGQMFRRVTFGRVC